MLKSSMFDHKKLRKVVFDSFNADMLAEELVPFIEQTLQDNNQRLVTLDERYHRLLDPEVIGSVIWENLAEETENDPSRMSIMGSMGVNKIAGWHEADEASRECYRKVAKDLISYIEEVMFES